MSINHTTKPLRWSHAPQPLDPNTLHLIKQGFWFCLKCWRLNTRTPLGTCLKCGSARVKWCPGLKDA